MSMICSWRCLVMIVSPRKHEALYSVRLIHCLVFKLPQRSVGHLLHAMKSVLAWQTSCRHIFKKARQFRSKPFQWRLSQLPCHDPTLQPCVFDVQKVLPLLRAWEGPTENVYGINEAKRIIRQACDVRVHGEAVLMHWIASVKV